MERVKKRFYFSSMLSPTNFNLKKNLLKRGWQERFDPQLAQFTDKNLNFDENAAQTLEYKHLLATLVSDYCPEIMPRTFCINDFNWPLMLNQIRKIKTIPFWILKPSLLNNGQAIKLFDNVDAIEAHFKNNQRLGGEHVLQEYISSPHLLRDDRKYTIRHFMILTNYAGAYLYHHGYFNVALTPYSLNDLQQLGAHLTNEHLQGDAPNVIQIPTNRFDWYKPIYLQIEALSKHLILGLQQVYSESFNVQKHKKFALFGMDFLVDAQAKAWLLEVNHGPCFPIEPTHPLQPYLYDDFWMNIVDNFVSTCVNDSQIIRCDSLTPLHNG